MLTTIPFNTSGLPIWEDTFPVMSSFTEQRRSRRFSLELPLSIMAAGRRRDIFSGVTKNISSNGVLFNADREPEAGSTIEYVVTLNASGPKPVQLRCMGKVLRAVPIEGASGFEVAATLERYEFVRNS